MIDRVVVPVDFSAESDRALITAPVLANWAGAGLELLTVVEPSERASLEPKLTAAARGLGNGTTYRIVQSGGRPESVLLTELHAGHKELWCVGSHARGAFSELFRESLSEDLIRDAHMPVVLVGPHCTTAPVGRFLAVALDSTDESEDILTAAADLAPALGMTLRLLQVADTGVEPLPADAIETGYLAHVAEKITPITRSEVDYDVLHGDDPAHSISDYVACHADVGMIALATRGLSGRARLIRGSTAFELAHRARIPVLILHHTHV
jgi:nucleotide-binding universal stress UspA family protein